MTHTDETLQRFLFEQKSIRGEIIHLDSVCAAISAKAYYPKILEQLLKESMAASLLMAATLKIEGRLSIQFAGNGPISMLYAEANHRQEVKCTAKWQGELEQLSFQELLSGGRLVVTIEPDKGERYQGIIPLEKSSLTACLEHYFVLSEQLPTHIALFHHDKGVSGIFLQQLPENTDENFWQHICIITQTLNADEIHALDNKQLLTRLYPEEDIRLFAKEPIYYVCGCSQERCERALLTLNPEDVTALLRESGGFFDMTCEFCHTNYRLNELEVLRLLKTQIPNDRISPTRH